MCHKSIICNVSQISKSQKFIICNGVIECYRYFFVTLYITCKPSVQFCTFPHCVYKGTTTTDFLATTVSQWVLASLWFSKSFLKGYYCSCVTVHNKANVIVRVCEGPHSPTQSTGLRFLCFPRQEVNPVVTYRRANVQSWQQIERWFA